MLDYADATRRHWDDGLFLLEDRRLANADHLFGLAAECALKAVMLPLRSPMKRVGASSPATCKRSMTLQMRSS